MADISWRRAVKPRPGLEAHSPLWMFRFRENSGWNLDSGIYRGRLDFDRVKLTQYRN